jgi:hypothetical protein
MGWLRDNTRAEDSVFIWGFEPHIYFSAQRRPASKFIYNVPQRVSWENEWAREQLMGQLEQSRPKVIVVEHGDAFSRVTGNISDSARSLLHFPQLGRFIDMGYERRERIDHFDIYVR